VSWHGNEDAGDLRAASLAGYAESLAEDGLALCEMCQRCFADDLDECPRCGGVGEEEGGCYGCSRGTPTTSFMDKPFCWDCYQTVANGEAPHDHGTFADPGGRSALRASFSGNPRVYPCPTCKRPGLLTAIDKRRGYQCDGCADAAERGLAWDE